MNSIVNEAEKHVIHLLNNNLDQGFVYHNIVHTQRVVKKTIELANLSEVNEHDKTLLILSAWFHDTGFIKNIENHEDKSIIIAEAFLKEHNQSESDIKAVKELILSTKIDRKPKNILEKILKDADCSHISEKDFSEISELLRKEWELTLNKALTESEWIEENINFLTTRHRFYSKVASVNWNKRKQKNLDNLLKIQKK